MEQFALNTQEILYKGYYPWPDLNSPYEDRMEKEANDIYDIYPFLSEQAKAKFKCYAMGCETGRMLPNPNIPSERLRPALRWMIWVVVFDDSFEQCPIEEFIDVRKRMTSVLKGRKAEAWENQTPREAAKMREELAAFMPSEWMDRFSSSMIEWLWYGLTEEMRYASPKKIHRWITLKSFGRYPS